MPAVETVEYTKDEFSSCIVTSPQIEVDPPGLLVDVLRWDSPFRAAGLRVGDLILAVDGKPVVRAGSPGAPPIYELIGQYGEYQRWAREGKKEGAPLSLTVKRRRRPKGWETLEIKGSLRAARSYRSPENRPLLGGGGPEEMQSDGFSSSWSSWYDGFSKWASTIQRDWDLRNLNNRYELDQAVEHEARVKHLLDHYPGPFAEAAKQDLAAATALLRGPSFTVKPEDLAYRKAEEARVAEASALAKSSWAAFLKAHEGETVAPFPAPSPIRDDIGPRVGKVVLLPTIRNRDWIPEAGHNYLAAGDDRQGWYFIDAETEPVYRLLRAARRYERLVSPSIPAEYQILGRVLPTPRLLVMNGRGVFGLQVEPIGALAGEAMFVDLSVFEGEISRFAGEEARSRPSVSLPADGAAPEEVLQALLHALEDGDQPLWKALFATWAIRSLPDGRPVYSPWGAEYREGDWEDSRRKILDRLYGARLDWVGEPITLTRGDEFPGAPKVEEVPVFLNHIGLFDGKYELFRDVSVHPFWKLQRLDGGPWRVSSWQGI